MQDFKFFSNNVDINESTNQDVIRFFIEYSRLINSTQSSFAFMDVLNNVRGTYICKKVQKHQLNDRTIYNGSVLFYPIEGGMFIKYYIEDDTIIASRIELMPD